MKAYITDSQGINRLKIVQKESPQLTSASDVLIDVKACSLNYRDLLVASGKYGAAKFPDFTPLSDMCGIVSAIGKEVLDLKVGDRVLNAPFKHWPAGLLRTDWARTFIGGAGVDGVLAQQIIFPADALVKVPDYLTDEEASTLTIAGLTAWSSLVTHGKTRPGEWVLLHGTGGVSIFGAQIAKSLGARPLMTTSCQDKAEFVKTQFGVEETFDYKDPEWNKKVKAYTKTGVDVVVDIAGGDILSSSLKVCNYGARVAQVGVLSGAESTYRTMDLVHHLVSIHGIFMDSTEHLRAFVKALEATKIKPHIDKVFSFSEAKDAYAYLQSQKHIGKVVITLG